MIKKWQEGYNVIYAKRARREGEEVFKKATTYAFYRVMQRMRHIKLPEDAGDFRLLSRRAVDAINYPAASWRGIKILAKSIRSKRGELDPK